MPWPMIPSMLGAFFPAKTDWETPVIMEHYGGIFDHGIVGEVRAQEIVLRGMSPNAIRARKTLCRRGHQLSGVNLCVDKRGHRNCRACWRENARVRYQSRRASK